MLKLNIIQVIIISLIYQMKKNILFLPESIDKTFNDVESLSKQSEIRYGLTRNGTTAALFTVRNYVGLCYVAQYFAFCYHLLFIEFAQDDTNKKCQNN